MAEFLSYFHDYMLVLLTFIILYVSYWFVLVITHKSVRRFDLDSHLLEMVWTVLPIGFLLLIALPSLYLLYLTEDFADYSVCVKAIAHQWYWEYEYASFGVLYDSYILTDAVDGSFRSFDVDNRVFLPVGMRSMVVVTSADVLHSWAVPSLGVKVDAIPGRLNYLNIMPLSVGVYYGQCSELCGANHSFIPIVVESVALSDILLHVKTIL